MKYKGIKMFQNFKKGFSKENKLDKKKLDKNLKLMSLSAIVLVVLFFYTLLKTDTAIEGTSYYGGMIFLFVLLILTFIMQKYKDKLRAKLHPEEKFDNQMETAKQEYETGNNTTKLKSIEETIQPITSTISFSDVAGISSIKEELEEVVDFLNHPKKFQKYDVSLPKGVLLVGPPGVGKTLIAKAVAGEAEVPFFYQSAASFVHIYVGMGAKRVRELFMAAKAKAPSIIFIDEIDAIGKERGLGSNDEREATLNELLTQMDGFESNTGVMIIAATNKIDVLDEALLRAGRFDRRVFLSLPSREDRLSILQLYLKNKKISFDLDKLASDTSGFNSAALSTLINEAVLNMIKREGNTLVDEDISQAKQKIQYGKKQIKFLDDNQKQILATYQAGKAFITQKKVTLFQEGVQLDESIYPSKTQLQEQIKAYLSGSVTLEVLKGESYAIFEQDTQQAYTIAKQMQEKYKMILSVDALIDQLKGELKTQIKNNIEQIDSLKNALLKDEHIVF
jgi:ATP-dependent metalloprotease FtsH